MMMMKCENAIFIFSLFWTWSLAWSGCRTILPILEETLPGDLDPDYCDNHNTPDEQCTVIAMTLFGELAREFSFAS